jgi:hypothetical protein
MAVSPRSDTARQVDCPCIPLVLVFALGAPACSARSERVEAGPEPAAVDARPRTDTDGGVSPPARDAELPTDAVPPSSADAQPAGFDAGADAGDAPADAEPADAVAGDTALVERRVTCTSTAIGRPMLGPARVGYRRDAYYPYGPGITDPRAFGTSASPSYPEARIPDPSRGGRFTVVAQAATSGALRFDRVGAGAERAAFLVEIDGRSGSELLDAEELDWIRAWPPTFTAGEPIWVMFHSRAARFDGAGSFTIRVPTDNGDAIAETLTFAASPLVLESVTASEDARTMLVQIRNESDVPQRIAAVRVAGVDATPCASALDVPALGVRQVLAALPAPAQPGRAWTVAVDVVGEAAAVGASRFDRAHFPIHAWPREADCPFPGIRDAAFDQMLAQGFDTLFARRAYEGRNCSGRSTVEAIELDLGARGAFAMPDDYGMRFTDPSRVRARLLGDEVDNRATAELIANGKMRSMAEQSTYWMLQEPSVPTYIGGSRSRHVGMFAGSTDLQGMDFYIAACAPHVTDFGRHPPLRAAYDYLRITQKNHRPMDTWLYTQGMGSWPAQPTPSEYRIQALSVLAAGAHGLMTFQTDLEEAVRSPDLWRAMGETNREVRTLGPLLRESAPTGAARASSAEVLVEALRVRGGMVVVVIDLASSSGPTDVLCALGRARPWVLTAQTFDLEVDVPDDMGVRSVLELGGGALSDRGGQTTVRNRTLVISGVRVDGATPGRIFVIADDPVLEASVRSRL